VALRRSSEVALRILIIDDSEDVQVFIATLLRLAGYTDLVTASTLGEAALYLAERDDRGCSPLDLILLDVMMPQMDGYELCRRIKADPSLQDIPVVMVTAKTKSRDLEEAFAAGANDYLTKPIERVEFMARVRSALRLKQEMDTRKAHELELERKSAELEAANARLRSLSALDGLTGIANRRAFDEFLEREWKRAIRKASSLAFIMVDIDHFKGYNDRYGHLAGDECLKQVAHTLAAHAKRPGDLVARFGGEEFGVILADTDMAGAQSVAEAMRRDVEALAIVHEASATAPVVTISLGVATHVPLPLETSERLVMAADRALYQAKSSGRNRFAVAGDFLPVS